MPITPDAERVVNTFINVEEVNFCRQVLPFVIFRRYAFLQEHMLPYVESKEGTAHISDAMDFILEVNTTDTPAVNYAGAQPLFGIWTAAMASRGANADTSYIHQAGRLGNYAATVGLHAKRDFELTVAAEDGNVMIPGMGMAQLRTSEPLASVSHSSDKLVVSDGVRDVVVTDVYEESDDWLPIRYLSATAGELSLRLAVEDLDPIRDIYGCPPAGRLTIDEHRRLEEKISEGWDILVRQFPQQVREIAYGLQVLVPLDIDRPLSGTNGEGLGALATSIPSDGRTFALSVMHEFWGHSRLAALNIVAPVCDSGRSEFPYTFTTWRPDPRPPAAMFSGVVPHISVADFWAVTARHAKNNSGDRLYAEAEFIRWHRGVQKANQVLQQTDYLTDVGKYLLERMNAKQPAESEVLKDSSDAEKARNIAAFDLKDHEVCFRLDNLHPDESALARLAELYNHNEACPAELAVPATIIQRPERRLTSRYARWELRKTQLQDPSVFHDFLVNEDDPDLTLPATKADVLLIAGDYISARQLFLEHIAADPTEASYWSGLAMTFWQTSESPAATTLFNYPEIAAALYHRLDKKPHPVHLALWLSGLDINNVPSLAIPNFKTPKHNAASS